MKRGILCDSTLPLKDLIGSHLAHVESCEESMLSRKSLLRRLLILVISLEEVDERDARRRKPVDVDILPIAATSGSLQSAREECCA